MLYKSGVNLVLHISCLHISSVNICSIRLTSLSTDGIPDMSLLCTWISKVCQMSEALENTRNFFPICPLEAPLMKFEPKQKRNYLKQQIYLLWPRMTSCCVLISNYLMSQLKRGPLRKMKLHSQTRHLMNLCKLNTTCSHLELY